MARKPRGDSAMTDAERQATRRARLKAQGLKPAWVNEADTPPVAPGRKPTDRRSRIDRWNHAVRTLTDLLDDYDNRQDSLPASMRDSTTAERPAAVTALRAQVDDLAAAELPRGFGRD